MDKNRIERPELLSPLVLAYIGDSVYEIFVRHELILIHSNMPVHKLHVEAVKYVRAHAQSNSVRALEGILTEEEEAVYKRGRNAKSPTVPRNADVNEYRRATGFEALIGYLYLAGRQERLKKIMRAAFDSALD
ncbi:MAG: Mini-ribonuclease 3 [Clostridia bacterium]|nr:Mini-ribonuclease 3 [Clostridia bacterium]